MPAAKLSDDALKSALQELPGWTIANQKLHREFRFPSFAHAFGFMTIAALEIDKRDHHPEWLNVYNRLTVDLITHDSQGITQKDVDLALFLERLAVKLT
jgi:4a-hydroxytetrahydrobiopterin dehydratase